MWSGTRVPVVVRKGAPGAAARGSTSISEGRLAASSFKGESGPSIRCVQAARRLHPYLCVFICTWKGGGVGEGAFRRFVLVQELG